jgi:hypothetical protein
VSVVVGFSVGLLWGFKTVSVVAGGMVGLL